MAVKNLDDILAERKKNIASGQFNNIDDVLNARAKKAGLTIRYGQEQHQNEEIINPIRKTIDPKNDYKSINPLSTNPFINRNKNLYPYKNNLLEDIKLKQQQLKNNNVYGPVKGETYNNNNNNNKQKGSSEFQKFMTGVGVGGVTEFAKPIKVLTENIKEDASSREKALDNMGITNNAQRTLIKAGDSIQDFGNDVGNTIWNVPNNLYKLFTGDKETWIDKMRNESDKNSFINQDKYRTKTEQEVAQYVNNLQDEAIKKYGGVNDEGEVTKWKTAGQIYGGLLQLLTAQVGLGTAGVASTPAVFGTSGAISGYANEGTTEGGIVGGAKGAVFGKVFDKATPFLGKISNKLLGKQAGNALAQYGSGIAQTGLKFGAGSAVSQFMDIAKSDPNGQYIDIEELQNKVKNGEITSEEQLQKEMLKEIAINRFAEVGYSALSGALFESFLGYSGAKARAMATKPATFESINQKDLSNIYKTLGIDKNTTMADAKSAYRKLAKTYHPDNAQTGNTEKFTQISNAYDNLLKLKGWNNIIQKPASNTNTNTNTAQNVTNSNINNSIIKDNSNIVQQNANNSTKLTYAINNQISNFEASNQQKGTINGINQVKDIIPKVNTKKANIEEIYVNDKGNVIPVKAEKTDIKLPKNSGVDLYVTQNKDGTYTMIERNSGIKLDTDDSKANLIQSYKKSMQTFPEFINILKSVSNEHRTKYGTMQTYKPSIKLTDRTITNVSNRGVQAVQQDYPELKPYIQEIAKEYIGDMQNTIPSQVIPKFEIENGRAIKYLGRDTISRSTSNSLAYIKDKTNANWSDISKAINDVLKDNGQENYALAKKIENRMDKDLTNGYNTYNGEIKMPPNISYIDSKIKILQNSGENIPDKYIESIEKALNFDFAKENPSFADVIPQSEYPNAEYVLGNKVLDYIDYNKVAKQKSAMNEPSNHIEVDYIFGKVKENENRQNRSLQQENETKKEDNIYRKDNTENQISSRTQIQGQQILQRVTSSKGGQAEIVNAKNKSQKLIQEFMKKNFDIDVEYYKANREFTPIELVNSENSRLILVRDNTKNNMLWATGHGFLHTLKTNYPELYQELYSVLEEDISMKQIQDYIKSSRTTEEREYLTQNKDLVIEEIIADEMGNNFIDKNFWDKLYNKSKELFEKVVSILKDVLNKIKGTKYNNELYDNQIVRMSNKMLDVIEKVRISENARQIKQTVNPFIKSTQSTQSTSKAVAKHSLDKIEDFGEKIGGARKDLAEKTGPRKTIAENKLPQNYSIIKSDDGYSVKYKRTTIQSGFTSEAEAKNYIQKMREDIKNNRAFVEDYAENRYIVRLRNPNDVRHSDAVKEFKDKSEAEEFAILLSEYLKNNNKNLSRPTIQKVERIAPNSNSENITGQDILNNFNFKGGEFGNWVKGSERQQLLNFANDSFKDLATALNISNADIGQLKQLGIGFGSRGHGLTGAVAHYEPVKRAINLTKLKGAGSLAHEYGHSIDNMLARLAKRGETSHISESSIYGNVISQDLKDAISNVINKMIISVSNDEAEIEKKNKIFEKNRIDNLNYALDYGGQSMESLFNGTGYRYKSVKGEYKKVPFTPTKEQEKRYKEIKQLLIDGKITGETKFEFTKGMKYNTIYPKELEELFSMFKTITGRKLSDEIKQRIYFRAKPYQQIKEVKSKSAFEKNSQELDRLTGRKSLYYSTMHEMWARAFESYIYDKLKEKGISNDFLVYGVENQDYALFDPYPAGEERKSINEAFDKLIDVMKKEGIFKNREGTKYSFGGRNAVEKSPRYISKELEDSYKSAVEMYNKGVPKDKVFELTNWFKDPKGDWKFEISDRYMKINNNITLKENGSYKLGDILEHNVLFALYPEIKNYNIRFINKKGGGTFYKTNKTIVLNNNLIKKDIKGTLIHEIQHAIQYIEGFTPGTTSKLSKLAYYKNLGEIEANDVKYRYINSKNLIRNDIPELAKNNPKHTRLEYYLNNRTIHDKIKDGIFKFVKGDSLKNEDAEEIFIENKRKNNDLVELGRGHLENKDNKGEIHTVYRKFKKDFEEKGYTDLNNIRINSKEDLADIGQVFRNPKYETFRVLYTLNDMIVGQEAVSSKIPGHTLIGITDKDNTLNSAKVYEKIKNRKTRLKADGYYLVHNHPSGNVIASKIDVMMTKSFTNRINGFKGHLIVNSGHYAWIDKDINVQNELPIKNYKASKIDELMNDNPTFNVKISNVDSLVELMHNVKNSPNYSTLILADSNNNVREIQDIPNSFWNMTSQQVKGYIKNQAKLNGVANAFFVTDNSLISDKTFKYVDEGVLKDSILYNNENGNVYSILRFNPDINPLGLELFDVKEVNKSFRVGEKENSYIKDNKIQDTKYSITDNKGRELTKQQQEHFKDSKVRDEEGRLLEVYHSTPNEFTVFDKTKLGKNTDYENTRYGIFVTPSKEFSERFKDIDNMGKKGHTMILYANIKKPIIHPYMSGLKYDNPSKIVEEYFTAINEKEALEEMKELIKEGEYEDLYDAYMGYASSDDDGIYENAKDEKRLLVRKGYDGLEIIEGLESKLVEGSKNNEAVSSYVVFNPNQIKNVDNLNPTENEDIRYSDRELTPREVVESEQIDIIEKTLEKIVASNKQNKFTKDMINELAHKMYSATVDNLHFMNLMVKDINNKLGKELKPNENPYILAMNGRKSAGTSNYIINKALVDMNGNIIGESLKDIIKSIPEGKVKEFENYLLHRHNINRFSEGTPVFGKQYTSEMSKKALEILDNKYPSFKEIAIRFDTFWDKFMKNWAVKSELIDETAYKAMRDKYPHYVPTNRAFVDLEKDRKGLFSGKGRKYVNQAKIIKKATGSEREIIRPFESIISNIERITKTARNNEVGKTLYYLANKYEDETAQWATNKDITYKEWKQLTGNGEIEGQSHLDAEGNIEDFMESLGKQYEEKKIRLENKQNIVKVMVDGQPQYIEIHDIDLLRNLKGMNNSDIGILGKILKAPTTAFKTVVTGKNPFFAVRNVARDTPNAYINGNSNNPLVFAKRTFKDATSQMLTNSEKWKNYEALGGTEGTYYSYSNYKLTNTLKDLERHNFDLRKLPEKTLDIFGGLNEFTENMNRFSEYLKGIEKYGDTPEGRIKALYDSGEVTINFNRYGSMVKGIDAGVPYLNANIQGIDKSIRQLLDPKISLKTIAKALISVTAISLLLEVLQGEDEDYKMLSARQKDVYWNIKIPGSDKFIKIPKPNLYGFIFGTLAERFARFFRGDEKAFDKLNESALSATMPTNPLENNILSPIITYLPKNKDFANRTIVPNDLQDLSPALQYDEDTSEIGKMLGKVLNKSPKKIDYLIKSYTGGLGELGLSFTTKESTVNPFIKNFVSDPVYSNDIYRDFYDNKQELETRIADAKKLGIEENPFDKEVLKVYNKVSGYISDINKARDELLEGEKAENKIEINRKTRIVNLKLAKFCNELADNYNEYEIQYLKDKITK